MKTAVISAILCLALCGCVLAEGTGAARFQACENKAGAGLYWVDTTTGRTWWAGPAEMKWVYCGKPEGGPSGPVGTFVPFENKSGEGVFILNTRTGAGWWTDGKNWKSLGQPRAQE
jgi:hypothetical protein